MLRHSRDVVPYRTPRGREGGREGQQQRTGQKLSDSINPSFHHSIITAQHITSHKTEPNSIRTDPIHPSISGVNTTQHLQVNSSIQISSVHSSSPPRLLPAYIHKILISYYSKSPNLIITSQFRARRNDFFPPQAVSGPIHQYPIFDMPYRT